MEIRKLYGFMVGVGKNVPDTPEPQGSEILHNSKLFNLLNDVLQQSQNECDVPIRFLPEDGKQQNEVRAALTDLVKNETLKSCIPIAKRLVSFTDHKTKEGLLFFVVAKHGNKKVILITRFPVEVGIIVNQSSDKIHFVVNEEVFLKNSKRYKSVLYEGASIDNDFWDGFAVDRQLNESSGNMKEISDYWIKDFLKSELKLNSKRGSKILAKAVRSSLEITDDEQIKKELIGISTLVDNLDKRKVSIESFFKLVNVSDATKIEVLKQLDFPNDSVKDITFVI